MQEAERGPLGASPKGSGGFRDRYEYVNLQELLFPCASWCASQQPSVQVAGRLEHTSLVMMGSQFESGRRLLPICRDFAASTEALVKGSGVHQRSTLVKCSKRNRPFCRPFSSPESGGDVVRDCHLQSLRVFSSPD